MAHTVLHFAPTARGSGDGSSAANAAQLFPGGNLSSLLTGFDFSAAGVTAYVQNTGTYTQSQQITSGLFTVSAPSATTNSIMMIAADASGTPIEPANYGWRCSQGALDTTSFCELNYTLTTGFQCASTSIHMMGFKVTGSLSSANPLLSNVAGFYTWCKFDIASTSSSSLLATLVASSSGFVNCDFKMTGASFARIVTASTGGILSNLRIVGDSTASSGTRYGLAVSSTVLIPPANGPIFIADCPGAGFINYNTANGAGLQASRMTIVNCGIGITSGSTVSGGSSKLTIADSVITGCTTGLSHPYGKYQLSNVVLRNTTDFGVAAGSYVGTPRAYITTETDSELYVNSTAGDYQIKATSTHWGKNRGANSDPQTITETITVTETITIVEVPAIDGPIPVVERSLDDTKPITFRFPVSGATVTGRVSIDNGSYVVVGGAIAFLRTEDLKHYYTLAFDTDDRPTAEGTARYEFTDGTHTIYVVLRVSATGGGGSSTESALLVTTTIATLASQTSFTLTAGSADDDAYNRQLVVITDAATATQKSRAIVADYVGSTRTVTLASPPAFTIAVGDSISIIAIGGGSAVTLTLGATIPLTAGEVVGFTEPIVIGDDYTEDVGRRIIITLTDTSGDAIPVEYGDHDLAVNCTIVALFHPEGKETVTTAISGECEYVAAVDDDPAYLLLTLPRAETAKAVQGTYQAQIEARWGDGFNVTMAYRGTAKFTRDIRRR